MEKPTQGLQKIWALPGAGRWLVTGHLRSHTEMSELEIGCVTDEGPHGLRDKGHDGMSASETCP